MDFSRPNTGAYELLSNPFVDKKLREEQEKTREKRKTAMRRHIATVNDNKHVNIQRVIWEIKDDIDDKIKNSNTDRVWWFMHYPKHRHVVTIKEYALLIEKRIKDDDSTATISVEIQPSLDIASCGDDVVVCFFPIN